MQILCFFLFLFSREALVGIQECRIGSSKSLCTTTSASPMEHGKFWVPHSLQKQNSFVQKEIQDSLPGLMSSAI